MAKLTLPLEVGKKYVTRCGHVVEVLCILPDDGEWQEIDRVICVFRELKEGESIDPRRPTMNVAPDGHFWSSKTDDVFDIVADYVPETVAWCSIYPKLTDDVIGGWYRSKEEAQEMVAGLRYCEGAIGITIPASGLIDGQIYKLVPADG